MSQDFDKQLDARGLNCPMPLVNARKEIGKLEVGQVLKVVATIDVPTSHHGADWPDVKNSASPDCDRRIKKKAGK